MNVLIIHYIHRGPVPSARHCLTEKKRAGTLLSVLKKVRCSVEGLTICRRLQMGTLKKKNQVCLNIGIKQDQNVR